MVVRRLRSPIDWILKRRAAVYLWHAFFFQPQFFPKPFAMGLSKLLSGAVNGIEAIPVEIEADASRVGDPQMVIVGLPDASVRESQHRVSTAISNSGFATFDGRITVNLAPADVRKDGSLFDLPIALAVLMASGALDHPARKRNGLPVQPSLFPGNGATVAPFGSTATAPLVSPPDVSKPSPSAAPAPASKEPEFVKTAVAGELSLGGEVRAVRGILPIAIALLHAGVKRFLVPEANAPEAAVIEGLDVYPVKSLRHAADILSGADGGRTRPLRLSSDEWAASYASTAPTAVDFADVKGQELAKRAIQVAVAGGHNILLIGPPGTGKSMLARCIPGILPPMTQEEALEATKIHSIAGSLPPGTPFLRERPFRSPHHTVSDIGLIGGGTHPSPGEVTLAHLGVLFLDELPEYSRTVLEVLRQPMEDGFVTISRASGSARFPARFILVAAMNPCPCGYFGDSHRPCRCSQVQVSRYRSKISGPLLDRIDLHISVPLMELRDLQSIPTGASSADLREGVLRARAIQQERYKDRREPRTNAAMTRRDVEKYCHLDAECLQIMNFAIQQLHFSPRSHDRILHVARTVADLAGHAEIRPEDLQEVLSYRSLDRSLWT